MSYVKNLTIAMAAMLAALLTGNVIFETASAEPADQDPGAVSEIAPSQTTPSEQPRESRGTNYVDADNDGVCDNRPANGAGCGQGAGFVDADGDGVCDNKGAGGRGCGQGRGYIDANGDGICDNRGNGTCPQRNGQGNARRGFVDADGDGVCDNQGSGERRQCRGQGHGQGQGKCQQRGHGNG